MNLVISLKKFLNNPSIPDKYHTNFMHLYLDIAWFGVLSGSAVNFINVYATRIGATGLQIGLLAATSAFVSLIFAMPAGRWLEQQASPRAVFWSSIIYRLGFLIYIPLPWLLGAQSQIWTFIFLSFLMGIPLVALSVGFGALFAESVPNEWRAHVAGIRNIVLSFTFMATSLVSGYLLDHLPFPMNYQIIFTIGLIGAAMSSYHLYFISPLSSNGQTTQSNGKNVSQVKEVPKPANWMSSLRIDVWKTPFRYTLLVMLAFHVAQYLALPVFPLFFVRQLKLSDENLGLGTALFYLAVLLGSTQLKHLVYRYGHKNITGWGVVGMAFYPGLLAISSQVWHYYGVSVLGGLAWALVGGASANYVIEKCPEDDRPSHLAWYNIILNVSVLTGSLLGPLISQSISLPAALVFFGVLRVLAGFAIIKWG